ncbi:MAG: hypothetical protein OEZ48_01680 [Candidatus Bathyarchaeota archaeon]|nr:hypothetical protein [Candidatus Bathyarchaeota archaeon]
MSYRSRNMIPLSHIRRVYTISRDSAIEILAYLAVSSIVMGNLLVADGYIFSLDPFFISKPQDKFYGLDVAWISGYLPFLLILRSLSHIVEPWVLQRILMFLILFLSGISAHKLCPTESHTGRLFAGLLYALNPFVYVRFMVGHWFILLGYSIMPLAVAKMIDLTQKPSLHQVVRAALLLTLVGIFSAHILFLCLLVSLIFLFYRLLQSNERLQLLKVFGTVSLLFFLLNMYWLMPGLSEKTVIEEFGYRDLLVFKSKILSEDVNIIFSLASMHGFWRQPEGYYYVSDMLPGYFLIYMFILFLTVRGFIEKHNDEKLGAYVTGLAVAAAVSLVLAIGISVEQLSSFFEFLFDTFFFFKGFRSLRNWLVSWLWHMPSWVE